MWYYTCPEGIEIRAELCIKEERSRLSKQTYFPKIQSHQMLPFILYIYVIFVCISTIFKTTFKCLSASQFITPLKISLYLLRYFSHLSIQK